MIIEIDRSVIGLASSSAASLSSVISTLELIAISYREGNHLVFAEPSITIELLGLVANRSELATALLLRVKNKHPQTATIANNVKVKLLIGSFDSAYVEETKNCRIIKYPATALTSNTVQKTIILVENLTDIKFYKWIANTILANTSCKGVSLAIEGYPGGGNTTAEAYENIKENTSRLCLCIVDSDIRAPGLSPGDTAKKVRKHDRSTPSPRVNHHIIDSCSIENLIPFAFFEHAWKEDRILTNRLDIYRPHYRSNHWKYLQLKKHITCFEVRDQSAFSIYWKAHFMDVATGCTTEDRSCSKKSECAQHKLTSLSSAPLAAVLSLQEEEMHNIPYDLLPDIKQAWEEISYELLSWCCAAPSSTL
ncbi:hypothetical protein [Stutzerimonas xanthomarina]|uniref:hypothetical protein n=1 Tax=Stutzerimonas xanthomarina TaxID=271420 RepID=UPI0029BF590D|nr:hypothetical protein [Stutzerimonas xanthomarina]MDX2354887.1 hypothetical protein [Stutzerimonas xanthomarina]